MTITKLDIAGNHVRAAIQIIAIGVNPYSTHVLVMAAEEMLLSLADAKGQSLPHDFRKIIRPEKQSEYRRLIRKDYNSFKHADRDSEAIYDRISPAQLHKWNEIMTIEPPRVCRRPFRLSHAAIFCSSSMA